MNGTSYSLDRIGSSSKIEIQQERGNTLLKLRKTMQLVRRQEHLSVTSLVVLRNIPAHQPAPNERMEMQVSEITSLGAGMLKSFTEHNRLRDRKSVV